MKFNEFAANFRNPEGKISWGGAQVQGPSSDVVLAGTVLNTEHATCIIDINGAQYEIPAAEVSDIDVVSRPATGKAAAEESGKDAAPKKSASAKGEKEEAEIPAGPQFALVKVNRNAVVCRRVPVQAAAVAALGTWVSIAAPETKSAVSPPTK